MISGIKKEYPKANKSVLQKAQYEQRNLNVNLKNGFKNYQIYQIHLKFKNKLDFFKKKKIFGRCFRWTR